MATEGTKANLFQAGNQASVGHGAPVDNINGFRSGRRSKRLLTVGKLPRGCSWINTLIGGFRRELEKLVCEAHSTVDYKAALIIQSAARHEQAALLAQRWLRLSSDTMSHTERLTYLQAIASESDKRDRCIDRLKLDVDSQTILSSLIRARDAAGWQWGRRWQLKDSAPTVSKPSHTTHIGYKRTVRFGVDTPQSGDGGDGGWCTARKRNQKLRNMQGRVCHQSVKATILQRAMLQRRTQCTSPSKDKGGYRLAPTAVRPLWLKVCKPYSNTKILLPALPEGSKKETRGQPCRKMN